MSRLFDNTDLDVELKTENEYAKNYDIWRKKEELNKLKTKYGDADINIDDDYDSSSSEDDEIGLELTEDVEKDFYKTLALLKKKDPKIYDENVVLFENSATNAEKIKKKSKKESSMFLKDYERKLLLEKGGVVSDSDDDNIQINNEKNDPTYIEEQEKLKEDIKKNLKYDESEDEDWDGIVKVRKESKQQKEKKEAEYKTWLSGQKSNLEDKEIVSSLKPLKEFWCDPNLEDGEKFLRDYILKRRYLDDENDEYIPTYDEIVHDSDENLSEDENAIEKQEEFEHKYNFRFEEPDQDFIKRYPRTIEHSVRKEDSRRKEKRAEIKERKAKEKAEKFEDLKKLRDLKRKEIEEKIEKLKEITGNDEMQFNEEDIDGDFDPEEHDRRMQALFNDDFYEGQEEDQKPKFDLEDDDALDLEIENFDNWTGEELKEDENEPHCEDENFNMDADYDLRASTQKELIENSKKKKKRKRKSKFVEMLAKERPSFDPNDKTYEEYLDEYYKLDCEDIIDDIPCRFKYKKVPANSFGLSVEEILRAKDRELNKWCSLKKAVQTRPDHVEKYDQIAFERKGQNIELKKKVLPSLFESCDEKEENKISKERKIEEHQKEVKVEGEKELKDSEMKKEEIEMKEEIVEKKNKKKRKKSPVKNQIKEATLDTKQSDSVSNEDNRDKKKKKTKKKSGQVQENKSDSKLMNETEKSEIEIEKPVNIQTPEKNKKKRKNKKKKINEEVKEKAVSSKRKCSESVSDQKPNKKFKKNRTKKEPEIGLSDARLSAYGLNAKKFKNKMIYKNKNKNS